MSRGAGPRAAGATGELPQAADETVVRFSTDFAEAAGMSRGAGPRAAGATGELPPAADETAVWFSADLRRRRA